jgi:carbon-monoxide dehydrogenase large subunit
VIIGAIVDALSRYGVQDIRMPATPYKVWQAIQDAKAQQAKAQQAMAG